MAIRIFHTINSYKEALGRIGIVNQPQSIIPEKEVKSDIDDVISAVNDAEISLKNVISIKESYKEILKMMM